MQVERDAIIRQPTRLDALRRLGLLDSSPEPAFDRLTQLAARVLHAPVTLISLVDADRQFFKSQAGLPEPWATRRGTPLSHSFCQHVVSSASPLIIDDARNHELVCDNLAIPELGVAAYAGIPLQLADGTTLGSFCAIDTEPRHWTEEEIAILHDFASLAMTEIRVHSDLLERQRITRHLAIQFDISRTLVIANDIKHAATTILAILGVRLGWDFGACWLIDDEDQTPQCQASWSPTAGIENDCAPPFPTACAEVLTTRQPLWNIAENGHDVGMSGMQTICAFAVESKQKVIGVVAFFSREPRPIDEDILVMAAALGGQFGLFVERIWAVQSRVDLLAREQTARADAEQAIRARDEFLSVAAHELKTPVATLYGHLQLLQRRLGTNGDERQQRSLRVMGEQARRLGRMMDQMLDVSRIVTGHFLLDRQPLDLYTLAQSVMEQIELTLEQHTITLHGTAGTLIIDGDELRLEQVLSNLIGNAVKYSPGGGAIEVHLSRAGNNALLAIVDHGIGIPIVAQDQLFSRFYRAGNAQGSIIGGMGIGLYVVQEIVNLHGGTVTVTSIEGQGSTFTVSLPLHES